MSTSTASAAATSGDCGRRVAVALVALERTSSSGAARGAARAPAATRSGTPSPRRRARRPVPMSRPSATQSPSRRAARAACRRAPRARPGRRRRARGEPRATSGRADRVADVLAVEQHAVAVEARCRRLAGSRRRARATARYIAPESRYVKPSASAIARATVDFPAPAGPSMATQHARATIGAPRRRPAIATMRVTASSPSRARFRAALDRDDHLAARRRHLPRRRWRGRSTSSTTTRARWRSSAWRGRSAWSRSCSPAGSSATALDRRRVMIAADLVRAAALLGIGRARDHAARSRSGTSSRSRRWCTASARRSSAPRSARSSPTSSRRRDLVTGQRAAADRRARRRAASRGPAIGGVIVAAARPGDGVPHRRRRRSSSARSCICAIRASARRAVARAHGRRGPSCARASRSCARSRGCGSTLISASAVDAVLPRPARGAAALRRQQRPRRRARAASGWSSPRPASARSSCRSGVGAARPAAALPDASCTRMWTVATLPLAGYALGHGPVAVRASSAPSTARCMTVGMVVWDDADVDARPGATCAAASTASTGSSRSA